MVKELEVKVLDMDIKKMQKLIISKGGKLIGRENQVNTLIDSSQRPIKSYMDAYLRIRENHNIIDGSKTTTFTLKKNILNDDLRENEEYNVLVDDKDTLLDIMKNLGFDEIKIGYKERVSYSFMNGRVDVDIWDKETYPHPYIEIEVSNENDLRKILEELEVPKENVSKLSIVELQKELMKSQVETDD
ncbi:class IV adenylate cyclase [Gudongella sp. DL1XJH-153]|uniref:class IV adenylate cyclase n=1 Tax=Gudongella sp. DL1XJH-153 TaxID=3409804 RepID=UPI003BB5A6A1